MVYYASNDYTTIPDYKPNTTSKKYTSVGNTPGCGAGCNPCVGCR
tara:strand:+ start:884 stop:1018 length:135 start_codon:yes stop_codon:yes gene_type:complete